MSAAVINQWAPPGAVIDFAGATVPDGWLICDGSAISRTTYAALFAAIGTLYGTGDGTTTFNLPDCRGRAAIGYTPSGGHSDVSTLGNNDGTLLANRRPKHKHVVTNGTHAWTNTGSANLASGSSVNLQELALSVGGSSDPAEAPAYLVLNKIIRAKDV